MRIVAGKFRGKNLVKSDHLKDLRPTTDKNREALFNILSSGKKIKELGFQILNSNVLDVCCGTGAVAFEAMSRGANSAFLIDKNQTHLKIVKQNILNLGLQNSVEVILEDVFKLKENTKFFDLIFIDPPYAEDYFEIIKVLISGFWIMKNSLVVIESKKSDFVIKKIEQLGLKNIEERSYGKTVFSFLTLS